MKAEYDRRELGRPDDTERREQLSAAYAPWLAARLEFVGALHLYVRKRYNRPTPIQVFPCINTLDTEEHVERIKDMFGGTSSFHKKGSDYPIWRWQAHGHEAVGIASLLRPFSPTWEKAVTAYEDWEDAEDVDEQVEIARELQQSGNRSPVTVNAYLQLVGNPVFLAGVFDTKAYPAASHQLTTLEFTSTNEPLLRALQNKYGGDVKLSTRAGSERMIKSRVFSTHHDTYDYGLGIEASRRLISDASPHILFQKELAETIINQ